ncbi:MAG: serine hydroxymethyltransferase [Patescibacteria group bacterium]|nr:MAG: serine hydroxymethyltransferase [Patescibacteria group bacterium]
MKYLAKTDPKIYKLIQAERKRQEQTLMMIPSENIVSLAVQEAVGSCLGNKYAEGYPKKRYYQGQEVVDQVELLAQERAKKLFKVEYVNVQPYSGSPANLAVYFALVKPKEKIMGLSLSAGGHLTHGANLNASSVFFTSVSYGVTKTGYIDYDQLEDLALKERPKVIVAGTTAYPRLLDWKRFAEIAEKSGSYLMADISHIAGLIVGGVYPSPVEYADIITSTTHKTLRGPRGAIIMVTKKGLLKDPQLDKKIDKAIIPGLQGGPHLNAIAGIATALKEASKKSFAQYAKQIIVNAKQLEVKLKEFGFNLVTGGTDSHLLLVDLRNFNLLGNTAAELLEKVNIVVNRNAVPFDPNPPFYPSGIRLGTPGITSRGMKKPEMSVIAEIIFNVIVLGSKLKNELKINDAQERITGQRSKIIKQAEASLRKYRQKVLDLCRKFPIPKSY